MEAAGDIQVREMLGHKVSRERIGAELDGMLNGPDPVAAVHVLKKLRLFEAVFEVHPSATADVTEEFSASGTSLVTAAFDILTAWNPDVVLSVEDRRLVLLASLLLPLRRCSVAGAKGRPQSMAAHVIRDSLKWRTKDVEVVETMHRVAPRLLDVHRQLCVVGGPKSAPSDVKIALGRCIRELKGLWRAATVVAALLPSPEARPLGVDAAEAAAGMAEAMAESELANALHGTDSAPDELDVSVRLEMCKELVAAAEAFGVSNAWQWKPLLDGKAVMEAVGMTRGGPALGKLMERVVDWQLAQPQGSREACVAWLVESEKASSLSQQKDSSSLLVGAGEEDSAAVDGEGRG